MDTIELKDQEPDAERIRAVLKTARRLLNDPVKWWDGGKGETCVVLAVIAAGPPVAARRACDYLAIAIEAPWFDVSYLYVWNDAPGRTHAQVLDALDRAIELVQ